MNTNDSAWARARSWPLNALSYPSYQSTSAGLVWLAGIEAVPPTIFVSPAGHVVEVHSGQYQTEATLTDDVQRLLAGH